MPYRRLAVLLLVSLAACDRVSAPPAPGSLEVTTSTTGVDMTQLVVQIDGEGGISRGMSPTDAFKFSDLTAGPHTVRLLQVAQNCTVQGDNPRTVTVPEGASTTLAFVLVCVATTGVAEITLMSTGLDLPLSYTVTLDGGAPRSIFAFGVTVLTGLTAGPHAVELTAGGLANCSAAGGSSRAISIAVGGVVRDTAHVAYDLTCTATTGVVEIAFGVSNLDFGNVFQVQLGNQAARGLPANVTTRISGVAGGDYTVALFALPSNCQAVGPSPSITVRTGGVTRDTARVSLQASCTRVDKIAFAREDLIMTVTADGLRTDTLTHGSNPAWSPDALQIVYSRNNCSDYYYCYETGLYVQDRRAGVREFQLTQAPDDLPTWSPDASTIAFTRESGYLQFVRQDGTGASRIALPAGTIVMSRPAWSPDGSRLVFGCDLGPGDYEDVCMINRTGTGFTRLTNSGRANDQPALNPQGTRIVFVREEFQQQRAELVLPYIAVMNADGTGITKLTDGFAPSWSRDGSRIVFQGPKADGLFTINADGTGLARLTNNPGDHAPAWRP